MNCTEYSFEGNCRTFGHLLFHPFLEGAYNHKQMHCVGFHLKILHSQNKDKAANFLFAPLILSLEFRGIKPRSNSLGLQWTLHPSSRSRLQNIPDAGKYLLIRKPLFFL